MKTKFLIIALVTVLALHAEYNLQYTIADDGYKYYLLEENGLVGVLSTTKDTIIRPEWKCICYTNSHFEVHDSLFMGIYNKKGTCIIGNNRGYESIYIDQAPLPSDHNFAWVCHAEDTATDSVLCIWKGEEIWATTVSVLCNWKGEEIWTPKNQYLAASPFYKSGHLCFLVLSTSQKIGFVDIDENIIIPTEYDSFVFTKRFIYVFKDDEDEMYRKRWSEIPKHENIFPKKDFNKL